ncbi:MAG: ECF-type sigma factor [Planctomycetota bacterium]
MRHLERKTTQFSFGPFDAATKRGVSGNSSIKSHFDPMAATVVSSWDKIVAMDESDDITAWIDGLRHGEGSAARLLWERYFRELVSVAAGQIGNHRQMASNEEDVALSAFNSFCAALKRGRFDQLTGRDSLWPLLVSITKHKSMDALRKETRQKRGGGRGRVSLNQSDAIELLDQAPTPEFAMMLREQFDSMLDQLDASGDGRLRRIALMRLEGHSIAEIATALNCVRRTVERKLTVIRGILLEPNPNA